MALKKDAWWSFFFSGRPHSATYCTPSPCWDQLKIDAGAQKNPLVDTSSNKTPQVKTKPVLSGSVLTLRDSQDRDRSMLLLLPFRRFILRNLRWTSSSMYAFILINNKDDDEQH